jgi:hypothetical protein
MSSARTRRRMAAWGSAAWMRPVSIMRAESRSRRTDTGYWMLDAGYQIPDTGSDAEDELGVWGLSFMGG